MSYQFQERGIAQLDFRDPALVAQSLLIVNGYQASWGRRLLDDEQELAPEELTRQLFLAPQAVLSHDRVWCDGGFVNVYNYANRAACVLFERSFEDFAKLPSRQSVASQQNPQQTRNSLLGRCVLQGAQSFTGERKSASGKSVWIDEGVLFNLADEWGVYRGQAAVLSRFQRQD